MKYGKKQNKVLALAVIGAMGMTSFGTSYALWTAMDNGNHEVVKFANHGEETYVPSSYSKFAVKQNGSVNDTGNPVYLADNPSSVLTGYKHNLLETLNQAFITTSKDKQYVYVGYQMELDKANAKNLPATIKTRLKTDKRFYNADNTRIDILERECKSVYNEIQGGANLLETEYLRLNNNETEPVQGNNHNDVTTYTEEKTLSTENDKFCVLLRQDAEYAKNNWFASKGEYSNDRDAQDRQVDSETYTKYEPKNHMNTVVVKDGEKVADQDTFHALYLINQNSPKDPIRGEIGQPRNHKLGIFNEASFEGDNPSSVGKRIPPNNPAFPISVLVEDDRGSNVCQFRDLGHE